jgi:hypothetical protein
MTKSTIIIALLLFLVLSACGKDEDQTSSDDTTEVVHDFFHAYRDENMAQLQTLACDGSEDKLNINADYLGTVSNIRFENLEVNEVEHSGDRATVHTEGTIYFTSEGEDQQNTFSLNILLRQVNGVWCLEESLDPVESNIELPTPIVVPSD